MVHAVDADARGDVGLVANTFRLDQDSGDLTINGILRSTFYSPATVPPGLPVPTKGLLIHSELQGVGAFNYDANSVYEALRPVGNCG